MVSHKALEEDPQISLWRNAGAWLAGGIVFPFVLLLVLRSVPWLDIWFSQMFFHVVPCPTGNDGKVCGSFALRADESWRLIRKVGFYFPQAVAVATLIWLLHMMFMRTDLTVRELSKPLLGLGSFFMGPVLLTNYFFKPFWGRPRPNTVDEFAGRFEYVLPGDISSSCVGNCSFVSGEAGAGFWLLWLVLVVPLVWRLPAFVVLVALAIFISGLRIAFGGHFFSDVMMAGALAGCCVAFMGWFLQRSGIVAKLEAYCRQSNATNAHRLSLKK